MSAGGANTRGGAPVTEDTAQLIAERRMNTDGHGLDRYLRLRLPPLAEGRLLPRRPPRARGARLLRRSLQYRRAQQLFLPSSDRRNVRALAGLDNRKLPLRGEG